jgi:hypothetical protein
MRNVTVRPKRKIPCVDYSGMEFDKNDEGSVAICKVKWNNKIPSYRWFNCHFSKVNELGDEDWCEEY